MAKDTEQNKNDKSGLTLILMRNAFYRDNYRRAAIGLILVACINIVLAMTIVYRYMNPPEPQYFPVTSQYQLIKWHPLSDPVVSNNYVLQWLSDSVRQAFSLDFIHWRTQLQNASGNFTPSGWQWFITAFKKSGNLKTLVKLHMVMNAVITGAPQIQRELVVDGRYLWKIEMPLMVTFTNADRTINLPMKVTVIVRRVLVQRNPDLIAISQFLPVVEGAAA